jgi:DNA-binding response OmpR family regulator
MHDIHSEPSRKNRADRSTSFPTVPIKDVPVPGSPVDTGADRPMVLVVRAKPDAADALSEILNRNGFTAVAVYDGEEALETALLIPPDLVIADVGLPRMSGIEMATVLKAELPGCKVLLLSGDETAPDRLASGKSAVPGLDVIETPDDPIDLLPLVSSSLKSR